MVQNDSKIVQSLVQGALIEIRNVVAAKNKLSTYKSAYTSLNPSLSDTNLTQQNVTDFNAFLTSLNGLCDSAIVSTLEGKDAPSHDTKGLD